MSLACDGLFKRSAQGGNVLDYAPASPRVFPVGRLDYESEGLIVLTNDGPFAASLLDPENGITKTYLALIESKQPALHTGVPSAAMLQDAIRHGVRAERLASAEQLAIWKLW